MVWVFLEKSMERTKVTFGTWANGKSQNNIFFSFYQFSQVLQFFNLHYKYSFQGSRLKINQRTMSILGDVSLTGVIFRGGIFLSCHVSCKFLTSLSCLMCYFILYFFVKENKINSTQENTLGLKRTSCNGLRGKNPTWDQR